MGHSMAASSIQALGNSNLNKNVSSTSLKKPRNMNARIASVFASLYDDDDGLAAPKVLTPPLTSKSKTANTKKVASSLVPQVQYNAQDNVQDNVNFSNTKASKQPVQSHKEATEAINDTAVSSAEKLVADVVSSAPVFTTEIVQNGTENCDEALIKLEALEISGKEVGSPEIRYEWTGTSLHYTDISIDIQRQDQLSMLIAYRNSLEHELTLAPHDPSIYIDLSQLYAKLGFCDSSASCAYRAHHLAEAGLKQITPQRSALSASVYSTVAKRLHENSPTLILDELDNLYAKAYTWLGHALTICGAFWDGLLITKKGLKTYPDNEELRDINQTLFDSWRKACGEAIADHKVGRVKEVQSARSGQIFQKKYPWMDDKLFVRTSAHLRSFNRQFPSSNCEIRRVHFGPPGTESTSQSAKGLPKNADVGPLGIFATKDIEEGEQVLVDRAITVTSDVPPSKFEFCDACHATLIMPFQNPSQVVHPECGCKVAFCSRQCHDTAVNGYHKVQCGIDFSWLYKARSGKVSLEWVPRMFLRVMSIVLSTPGYTMQDSNPKNPLIHPLLIRMTANYSGEDKLPVVGHDWGYEDNLVAPTRILLSIGVNIFSPTKDGKPNIWTQELIQTIIWRMENNANATVTNLKAMLQPESHGSAKTKARNPNANEKEDGDVQLVVLSPNYLFFNHSCVPNTSWHGTVPNVHVGLEWLLVDGGEVLQPGSGTVVSRAGKHVKAGEELKISYVGNPLGKDTDGDDGDDAMDEDDDDMKVQIEGDGEAVGEKKDSEGEKKDDGEEKTRKKKESRARKKKRALLLKWFANGCGCEICNKENKKEVIKQNRKKTKERAEEAKQKFDKKKDRVEELKEIITGEGKERVEEASESFEEKKQTTEGANEMMEHGGASEEGDQE